MGGSFEVSSGKRNVVSKLTGLVGQEDVNIIVAYALELNGAMIANAEVDEEGNYKDVGNLILTVGELFVKHLYDSDERYTLGASINYITANTKEVIARTVLLYNYSKVMRVKRLKQIM